MKETPIIMSGNHPKLILDGLKTMTRRTQGLDKINKEPDKWRATPTLNPLVTGFYTLGHPQEIERVKCPYGQVGDILVIKETWATENRYNHLKPSQVPRTAKIWYLCDEQYDPFIMGIARPSMFMCLWMSGARPVITEVRVERLTEISEEDAVAEGMTGRLYQKATGSLMSCAYDVFHWYWDSLNAKRGYGWDTNCWVRVISFKVV